MMEPTAVWLAPGLIGGFPIDPAAGLSYFGRVPAPLLQLDSIAKSFPGVQALKPLNLEIAAGEVAGLVGENGAGKSTLIRIISGVIRPSQGRLFWREREMHFQSPLDAMRAGIATIHQELAYFGQLSVAENLMMDSPWPRHFWGGIHWPRLHHQARQALDRFELEVSTDRPFVELSAAQKQEVAIVRALSKNARLLILDEPTASLTEPEVKRLFRHLTRLRQEQVAILYVSHRLDEILELTDRIVVLRDGEHAATLPTPKAGIHDIVKEMVGRPLDQIYPKTRSAQTNEPLLEVDGVTRRGLFHDVRFTLHAGEIVGLAGLVGAGRSELARAIYGLYPVDQGSMRWQGRPWKPSSPSEALAAGLIYLPEERKRQGLVLEHSVRDSISIGFSDLLARWGLIRPSDELAKVLRALQEFGIRANDTAQPVGTLSGGNQQKAMLARWLTRRPKVLILDEPTRGVDVGAKAEIHALIDQLAAQGQAILLISSDLPEVLGMSDRVLVMHQGRISAELKGDTLSQENVILAASGLYETGPPRQPNGRKNHPTLETGGDPKA